MPESYKYLHYDVFTDRRFQGNQLAVFLDGRGLSTETMQSIAAAAALGLSRGEVQAGLPVQTVSCGVPFLFVPLAARSAVDCAETIRRPCTVACLRRTLASGKILHTGAARSAVTSFGTGLYRLTRLVGTYN